MTLERAYIRTTYLLTAIGFLSIIISGELPLYLAVIAVLSLILSYDYEGRTLRGKVPQLFWNIVGLFFMVYEAIYAILGQRELVLDVMEFLVVIQVIRLWTRTEDRHYVQIYGLSLLQLIAAAVLNADLSFALVYIAYIIAGTWALVVFNLQRELKTLRHEKTAASDVREILTPKFFSVLTIISLLVFFSSIILFTFFPRLNYNYFAPLIRHASASTGFSDQVRLGQVGQITLNRKPVMRVILSGPAAANIRSDNLYLRGMILNHYDGKRWKYIPTSMKEITTMQSFDYFDLHKESNAKPNLNQEIVLEPTENDALFVISMPISMRLPYGFISHYQGENIGGVFTSGKRIKYSVSSAWKDTNLVTKDLKNEMSAAYEQRFTKLRNSPELRWKDPEYRTFLQVPRNLDPRIKDFAIELTQNIKQPYLKILAINQYLKTRLSYSLNLADPGDEDPLAFFLFKNKSGHCEYFAASLAIMLRTLGIPSRVVNGYYHGEWNKMGKYYLIRESDAHTWVEALVPGHDGEFFWAQFDPTPSDPALLSEMGYWEQLRQAIDSVRLVWVNWVVDYDIQKQSHAVDSAYKQSKKVHRQVEVNIYFLKEFFQGRVTLDKTTVFWIKEAVAFFALFFLGVFLLQSLRRFRKQEKIRKRLVVAFYEKMVRILEKRGIARQPHLTPMEYCDLASGKLTESNSAFASAGVPLLQELTKIHARVCYGGKNLSAEREKYVYRLLKQLKKALKQH